MGRGSQIVKWTKEYKAEYQRQWRSNNPNYQQSDRIKEQKKEWEDRNAERVPELRRDRYLKQRYGISAAEYDIMLAEQHDGCAICGKVCPVKPRLSVDHCHDTNIVRGLLCHHCNLGIGCFMDDIELLKKTIAYLEGK